MEFTPEQLNTAIEGGASGGSTTVVIPPTPVTTAHYVECGFCQCKLTPVGNVYEISDKARDYRDDKETHRKEIAKLTEEITRKQVEITQLESKLREVQKVTAKSKFL
jgi:septal ring factor EnvC (AmiA/AmiB activator)